MTEETHRAEELAGAVEGGRFNVHLLFPRLEGSTLDTYLREVPNQAYRLTRCAESRLSRVLRNTVAPLGAATPARKPMLDNKVPLCLRPSVGNRVYNIVSNTQRTQALQPVPLRSGHRQGGLN